MDAKDELREILKRTSLFRGQFVLASGKTSEYYFDCKLTTLSEPRGLKLAAQLLYERIARCPARIDAVGGLVMGSAPLVVGISLEALAHGTVLPGFMVRKDPKPHGRAQLIEGVVKPGANVAIVDDVVTSGGSVLKAIRAAEQEGARVVKVLMLVDREEGAAETLRDYDHETIFSFKDLLDR
jgi:orotate phosphoribosyltransferase